MKRSILTLVTVAMGLSGVSHVHAAAGAPEWVLAHEALAPTVNGVTVFDSARGRVLLFGGKITTSHSETWEWDGRTWIERTPPTRPPNLLWPAMAYDSVRRRVVLFGGISLEEPEGQTLMADTWEWDGNDWVKTTPETSPPARSEGAMAYDSDRGRVVLFGGFNGTDALNDTWEWDGTNWIAMTPPAAPGHRLQHAMTYDAASRRVVLFGGRGPAGELGDTWEWDGAVWTRRAPSTSPRERHAHDMTYDVARACIVLNGGLNGNDPLVDTWEWNGTDWTERTPDTDLPPLLAFGRLAYDGARGRVVLYYFASTWEWDGASWSDKTPADTPPSGGAIAYDSERGRTVFVGGTDGRAGLETAAGTWEWDGSAWTKKAPATAPPAHLRHSWVYDSRRGLGVLFGGSSWDPITSGWLELYDTWEWNGTTWTQRIPATRPTFRFGNAMAFDSRRGLTVLFDGRGGSMNNLGSMWEWNGEDWSFVASPPWWGPADRQACTMVYDALRDRLVLYGGSEGGYVKSDTWEWDGTNWLDRGYWSAPGYRFDHAMAYDSRRGRTVLFGGMTLSEGHFRPASDTWEWDGDAWIETTPATVPGARQGAAIAYDSARGRVVLYGGSQTDYRPGEVWEYGPISGCSRAASVTEFTPGSGADAASADASLGAADDRTVSLGLGGSLVLRMSPPIASGSGTDFIVYASSGAGERYRVEASSDNDRWVFVRDCPGGECHFDLAATDLSFARYIRITDLARQEDGSSPPTAGADIDAVVALRCAEECSVTPTAPPDGATFEWKSAPPTFTWTSTCELTYRVEFSNNLKFSRSGLFVLPAQVLHEGSFTPNRGNWTAIGNLAKNRGGTGKVYWRVVGRGADGDAYRSAARAMTIEWPSKR